jgi:hypothetical protein
MKECAMVGKQMTCKFELCAKLRIERAVKMTQEGVHPRCDRKSAQAIEKARVAGVPSAKRVRKQLEAKELNEEEKIREAAGAAFRRRCARQTRERIAESTLRVNYFIGTVRMGRQVDEDAAS